MPERGQARDERRCFRLMLAQRLQSGLGFPDKHPGVPEVAARLIKFLRDFWFRFFVEAGDFKRIERSGLDAFCEFDVAVSGLGPARLDAENTYAAFFSSLEGRLHELQISFRIPDNVIGRKDSEYGFR